MVKEKKERKKNLGIFILDSMEDIFAHVYKHFFQTKWACIIKNWKKINRKISQCQKIVLRKLKVIKVGESKTLRFEMQF